MKKIYHLSTCNTCQRIMSETGTEGFQIQDIKEQHISGEDLDHLKEHVGSYEDLFNKRAIKYRSQGLNEQNLSEADFRTLILKEYTFLKRPVYVIDDDVFVGNSKKTVAAIKEKIGE